MVAMSQDAFKKFSPELRPDGTLLVEEDLVKPEGLPPGVKVFAVPATRIAEELGRKMVLNIVMVGFFTAVTGLISEQAAKEAVKDSVPPSTIDLNMKAFDRGFAYGKKLVAKA
jgi:2-oxoglutarate ferredoxin oxidoreductase subunit gamma